MIATSMLLDAWERGSALPLPDRAPSVLAVVEPSWRADELTVGECDVLIFEAQRRLFGDLLDASTHCVSCGDDLSLLLPLHDLQPEAGSPPDIVRVEMDGYLLLCRTIRNHDLRELSRFGADLEPRDIVRQCLVQVVGADGSGAKLAEVPAELVDAALQAVADADPAAHVWLSLNCPCGANWTEQLDIRTIFWSELGSWAARVLQDVAQLARHYGWSERDILELSAWRRAWYVQSMSS